jgi:hypothetical protein
MAIRNSKNQPNKSDLNSSDEGVNIEGQLEELVEEIEGSGKPLTGPEIEKRILQVLPKEKVVMVEFLKPIAGIKAGFQKNLPLALAKRMEKAEKVKIL